MEKMLVIIPSYNEEENISGVLKALLNLTLPLDILVVNDGSVDRTEAVASQFPVRVVTHPINLGYGAALQTGYKIADMEGYSYVIQFDADGQHSAEDIPAMLAAMKQRKADIIIGSRYLSKDAFAPGWMKLTAVFFFRNLIYFLTGAKVSDPTSGFRCLSSDVFSYYAGRGRFPADFPDADMLIHMILREYRVSEVPVHMRERVLGVSMHAGLKPVFYMIKMLLSILIVFIDSKSTKKVRRQ